ncbi:MAG: hypothetical protein Q8P41_02740 [Pseudomonadota bacterium]|nr:hypothetical protein [Pseudomonadota bacterium]
MPTVDVTAPPPAARSAVGPALASFGAALAVRLLLLARFPDNIGLDGFQRWAGRDWLLVQGWLPGPQALIWAADALGFDVLGARVMMAVVASLAVAAGAALAQGIGGPRAGWLFGTVATFGPFALWGTALYQEGVFLLLLFTGLALAVRGRLLTADLVLGALGLVRYEAWPLLVLYVAWRRSPMALLAGWGALVWVLGRAAGWAGHAASPIDYFSDWEGLGARFTLAGWLADAGALLTLAVQSGAVVFAAYALVGVRSRARGTWLVMAMVAVQLVFVAVWMVGLERATPRMLILPTMIAAVVGAVGLARAWEHRIGRGVALAALLLGTIAGLTDAWGAAAREARWTRPERAALDLMETCVGCRWWVEPRTGIGPRDRHDGCEILQGVSDLRHGEEFLCAAWPADAAGASSCQGRVAWNGKAYEVTVVTAQAPTSR